MKATFQVNCGWSPKKTKVRRVLVASGWGVVVCFISVTGKCLWPTHLDRSVAGICRPCFSQETQQAAGQAQVLPSEHMRNMDRNDC